MQREQIDAIGATSMPSDVERDAPEQPVDTVLECRG